MSKRMFQALTATVVAIALASGGVAQATDVGPRMKLVKFDARFTEPLPTTDGAECDGLSAPPPACGLHERSSSTFEAPFAGTSKVTVVGRFSAMTQ